MSAAEDSTNRSERGVDGPAGPARRPTARGTRAHPPPRRRGPSPPDESRSRACQPRRGPTRTSPTAAACWPPPTSARCWRRCRAPAPSAAGNTSSAGNTRLPNPSATARFPSKVAPVRSTSAAFAIPISRGSTQCEYASPTTPRRTCTTPYLASAANNRMSHCSASVSPKPNACPLIAAITGLLSAHAGTSSPAALKPGPGAANVASPAPRSAPAQNAGGVPVSTNTRTASSPSSRVYASASSSAHAVADRIALTRPIERDCGHTSGDRGLQRAVNGQISRVGQRAYLQCERLARHALAPSRTVSSP